MDLRLDPLQQVERQDVSRNAVEDERAIQPASHSGFARVRSVAMASAILTYSASLDLMFGLYSCDLGLCVENCSNAAPVS